ncbi:MAG: hypothetical protein NDI82_07305 [Anaeromyxobacteraceae bacterium]|nr:hypothetical protein [Anaeromyxobacteraceae bacterium]
MGAGSLGLTVQALQARLQSIYRVEAPGVEGYLVGREVAAAAGHAPRAGEELLVLEEPDGLSVGLYLEEAVGAGAVRGELGPTAQAAEGVSHFVYLSTRAACGRPVSLLELEVQAEVDKFALLLLPLPGRPGVRRRRSRALRRRLYERVRYLEHLGAEELGRYREANRLGAGYARWLEGRFVEEADVEGLLRELRQSYRLGAAEKLGYLASRG